MQPNGLLLIAKRINSDTNLFALNMTLHKKNNSPLLTIEGHLEHITYFNEDTHYTIARLKPAGLTAVVTVVGYLAGVSLGETIKVNGRWETHPKYGQQLKIDSFEVTLPAGIEGIRTYLGSGIVKGIGPSLARRMVKAFGAETLEIIEGLLGWPPKPWRSSRATPKGSLKSTALGKPRRPRYKVPGVSITPLEV